MAGCVVNPPAVSDGSSGAFGTVDTRSAAEAFLFFFFLAGAKGKACHVGNGLRGSCLLITLTFTLGRGQKISAAGNVQPCLRGTELVCSKCRSLRVSLTFGGMKVMKLFNTFQAGCELASKANKV